MKRDAEIQEMASAYASHMTSDKDMQVAFADALRRGAEWADAHPHWISVEDELPPTSDKDDESDDYLIVDSDGDKNVGYYNKMDKLWFSCDGYILDVTHWMPLPSTEGIRGNQGKTSPNKGKNDIEIQVKHDPNFDDATRTIYDVMADESYAIATEDEEGGENG